MYSWIGKGLTFLLVVGLLVGCAPKQAPSTAPAAPGGPMAPSGAGPNATALPSSPTDGAGIFAGTCARCHGSQGEGKQVGGRGAPAIQGTPLDEVVTTVTQGKKAMPSFGSRLSKEQIQAVAEYVSKQLKS